MNDKRVLVTGASGMLGEAILQVLAEKQANILATDIATTEPNISYLDIRDINHCNKICHEFRPNIVIHLGALVDLEYCELNADNAWLTNALGTENIALLSKKYGAQMVYISTAGVFDGDKDVYNDFDTPNPLGIYAKSKYYSEVFVQQYLSEYYIFRAGWMMGGGVSKDKKFINKIYKKICSGVNELFIVEDKLGTPTYTYDFARNIFIVIELGYFGLYNQVSLGGGSRYDVAEEFINLLGLQSIIKLNKVGSAYFSQEFFAPRPQSEKLINLKLESRGLNQMRHWKDCLKEYSKVFLNHYGKI